LDKDAPVLMHFTDPLDLKTGKDNGCQILIMRLRGTPLTF
jgi:hypothetical protein